LYKPVDAVEGKSAALKKTRASSSSTWCEHAARAARRMESALLRFPEVPDVELPLTFALPGGLQ
jgi:hypothetical protein